VPDVAAVALVLPAVSAVAVLRDVLFALPAAYAPETPLWIISSRGSGARHRYATDRRRGDRCPRAAVLTAFLVLPASR